MAAYIVGYDLNRPRGDDAYPNLFEAIKRASNGSYWHLLDSTWIVHSEMNIQDIGNSLVAHIDSNDKLLVAKLDGEAAWTGFSKKGSDWLKNNL